jgi:alginate O-acetyltransferase complex protein AlgI
LNVGSIEFVGGLAALAVLFHIAPTGGLKRLALIVASALFLNTFIDAIEGWIAVGAFVAGGYLLVRITAATRSGHVIAGAVLLAIVTLLYVRQYEFIGTILGSGVIDHPFAIIGISYMSFKLIHVLVDTWQGDITEVKFQTFIVYQLSFFTLLAGPIQRYPSFAEFWEETKTTTPDARTSMIAWSLVFTGMLKIALIGLLAFEAYDRAMLTALRTESQFKGLAALAIMFYAFPVFIYFNFSGYTDIVRGAGRLFGLDLPENFRRPYLARNMVDFWNRWHITLSHWIRDYVFTPSYKWIAMRSSSSPRLAGIWLSFFALLIAGIWHGSTMNFVYFGLIHGVGVAGTQIWGRVLLAAVGSEKAKAFSQHRVTAVVMTLITFHYVAFSFIFFPSDLDRTFEAFRNVARAIL